MLRKHFNLKMINIVAAAVVLCLFLTYSNDDENSGLLALEPNDLRYALTVSRNLAAGGTVTVNGSVPEAQTMKLSAGSSVPVCTVTMSDNRTLTANFIGNGSVTYDGQTYRTVVIGGKEWMAENLNYAGSGGNTVGVCYGNNSSNCAAYGRLYTWSEAMELPGTNNNILWNGSDVNHQGICPSGWHLPSDAEWTELTNAVGGSSTAGTKLKSTSGWSSSGNGTDNYGFSALPGGTRGSGCYVYDIGYDGTWWSATEIVASHAWNRLISYHDSNVYRDPIDKSYAFSVRCVRDVRQ